MKNLFCNKITVLGAIGIAMGQIERATSEKDLVSISMSAISTCMVVSIIFFIQKRAVQ